MATIGKKKKVPPKESAADRLRKIQGKRKKEPVAVAFELPKVHLLSGKVNRKRSDPDFDRVYLGELHVVEDESPIKRVEFRMGLPGNKPTRAVVLPWEFWDCVFDNYQQLKIKAGR